MYNVKNMQNMELYVENVENMQKICKAYAKICKTYAQKYPMQKHARNLHNTQIIRSKYATNMQKNMQNMFKICRKYAQNMYEI